MCHTVIEILAFNKWSEKITVSRSVLSYLLSMELTLTSASTQLSHWRNKTNRMVFSTEDPVVLKVVRQEKGYDSR